MLNKLELIHELKNLMRVIKTLTFESCRIQNELYEMMADVVCEEIKDGGILKVNLKDYQDRLEIVLGYFQAIVKKNVDREMSSGDV